MITNPSLDNNHTVEHTHTHKHLLTASFFHRTCISYHHKCKLTILHFNEPPDGGVAAASTGNYLNDFAKHSRTTSSCQDRLQTNDHASTVTIPAQWPCQHVITQFLQVVMLNQQSLVGKWIFIYSFINTSLKYAYIAQKVAIIHIIRQHANLGDKHQQSFSAITTCN